MMDKQRLGKLLKILPLPLVIGGYLFGLSREIDNLNEFCAEMTAGLEVSQIAAIAEKHDVSFNGMHDADAISQGRLGIHLKDQQDTWFLAVGAPMTLGEHACGIYHDQHVVLKSSVSRF